METIIDIEQLISDYSEGNGLNFLCSKYHIGKLKAKKILTDNGIEINKPCSYSKNRIFVVKDWRIEKYRPIEGCHYIAESKLDGKVFDDYKNEGGYLTSYIRGLGVDIPSLYDRRLYYQTTGDYWWEQWFTIKSIPNNEVKKCPYCEWETIDICNNSGAFEMHLKKAHNLSKESHLRHYPQDLQYFSVKNITRNLQMEMNENNYVSCAVCGKKLKRIDWRHLSSHGLTLSDYISKYGDNTVSNDLHSKLSNNAIITNQTVPFHKESKPEIEIKNFLISNGINVVKNRKILDGKEIDIFIPEKNLGIEFNGNFYHTEFGGGKDKNYHLNKTKMCNNKGIFLIQIFEDEWELSKDIVISKIKRIVGLDNDLPRIYARKCNIVKLDGEKVRDFLNKNHIQGYTKGSVHYGALYNNVLIGVMSFVQRKKDEWELVRFATDNNSICCGVGSRLFSRFVKDYNPIIVKSFADRRWTMNVKDNFYTKIGFKLESVTPPDYRYFNQHIDRIKRFHKFGFRKNIMMKKYGKKYNLDDSMTELEMAKKIGCDRIWDCGMFKYVWRQN